MAWNREHGPRAEREAFARYLMLNKAARTEFHRETIVFAEWVTDQCELARSAHPGGRAARSDDPSPADFDTYREALTIALLALREWKEEQQAMENDSPYRHIPSLVERAAARRRIEQTWQGDRLTGPLPHNAAGTRPSAVDTDTDAPPEVHPEQTRHAPMHGRHTHDHAAGDAPDADDGIHRHAHVHSGDAIHRGPSHTQG
ncbi:MAG: hypothetical protein ACRDPD_30090 [Streptosporangiaceae bacterium]